jgi:hypothetical protein
VLLAVDLDEDFIQGDPCRGERPETDSGLHQLAQDLLLRRPLARCQLGPAFAGGDDLVQVRGGQDAVVGGGRENSASAEGSTVSGGFNNLASGPLATVAGGSNNAATALYASVVGGTFNRASGSSSLAGGGSNNTASGSSSRFQPGWRSRQRPRSPDSGSRVSHARRPRRRLALGLPSSVR